MTKKEELEAFSAEMKKMDVKTVGNLQLLEMFELWSYEISEGFTLDRNDVQYYYDLCRQELLYRMKK